MNARAKAALINCKTPAEYIDKCVKSSLTCYEKSVVTREWCKLNGFTVDDIKYARNRHPYWKKKKHHGYKELNLIRFQKYDYSDLDYVIEWTDELLEEFVMMNKKKDGKYINKDYELAEHFGTTIPSIQYLRRKYLYAIKLLKADKLNSTDKRILKLMCKDIRVRRKK